MRSISCALACLSVVVLSGAGMTSAARADNYTLQIGKPVTITNLIAIDKDTDGTLHFSWPYTATQGLNVLTNPNLSPNASSYYLAGTFLIPGETRAHAFFTMNESGAAYALTKSRLDQVFGGISENTVFANVDAITKGTPTDIAGGEAFFTNWSNSFGDLLFTKFGEQTVSMQFSLPVNITQPVPVPAAVSQGAVVLGLLGLGALVKRARRHSA